jgi:hypothetical protein
VCYNSGASNSRCSIVKFLQKLSFISHFCFFFVLSHSDLGWVDANILMASDQLCHVAIVQSAYTVDLFSETKNAVLSILNKERALIHNLR